MPVVFMPGHGPQDDNGSEPPDNGGVEARLTALETKWETVVPTLATKGDVQSGFAEVRADVHKMDASIKTWMVGSMVGLFLGFGGLFFAMSNSLKPAAAPATAQQPAPIIINVPTPAAPQAPAATATKKP